MFDLFFCCSLILIESILSRLLTESLRLRVWNTPEGWGRGVAPAEPRLKRALLEDISTDKYNS